MKLTPVEQLLLAPYEKEIVDLYAVQVAVPQFGIVAASVQMRDAIRSAVLYIALSERAGEPKATRAKHLEHMLSAVQETFASDLKRVDEQPQELDNLIALGKRYMEASDAALRKPKS